MRRLVTSCRKRFLSACEALINASEEVVSGPSFSLFGAYFPSWMLCLGIAIVLTAVLRVLFIRIGLDDSLPLRLTTYTAITVAIACGLAFFVYGR